MQTYLDADVGTFDGLRSVWKRGDIDFEVAMLAGYRGQGCARGAQLLFDHSFETALLRTEVFYRTITL